MVRCGEEDKLVSYQVKKWQTCSREVVVIQVIAKFEKLFPFAKTENCNRGVVPVTL